MALLCPSCPHEYFCCTFRVKLTWLDILKIRLKGHRYFWERDPQNIKVIKLNNQYCRFLKNNRCQIYKIRPQPCHLFPHTQTCQELYQPWKKHQQMIQKHLNK